jgi:hypothetical protein
MGPPPSTDRTEKLRLIKWALPHKPGRNRIDVAHGCRPPLLAHSLRARKERAHTTRISPLPSPPPPRRASPSTPDAGTRVRRLATPPRGGRRDPGFRRWLAPLQGQTSTPLSSSSPRLHRRLRWTVVQLRGGHSRAPPRYSDAPLWSLVSHV